MRIEAQGDGASATLAVMSERESAAAEPPRRGRRRDGRGGRGAGPDDPVDLPHRSAAQGERAGGADRQPAGRDRRHADAADGERPLRGAAARLGAERHPQRRPGGAHHLPPRQRPSPRPAGQALDRRRRRTGQPRGLRQPSLRGGLHRPVRGDGGGDAGRRRLHRGSRAARHARLADDPRGPPHRRHRRRRRRADGAAERPWARRDQRRRARHRRQRRGAADRRTSSRTRRSSAPATSPSAPRRRSAARCRCRSTSTAWCSNRRSKSTARRSSAAATCWSERPLRCRPCSPSPTSPRDATPHA